ncbi:hypothetical protein PWEIH_04331 [Listeria weihenstephanensis FSL R9-0317]|uniref:Uncharacterized protein n=1 Tax=Listeria weihenstephanensis TaxID=1006155 RepID=A0A1S7FRU3_9LIST|nr:hypothetical protein UE46_02850 [Listeria weihenstephanensis]EUJ40458.1 hypothetical protein PWEIH_04331 [Listeria weihenstephanensis FSL R9-0317]
MAVEARSPEKRKKPVRSEKAWSGRSENPFLVFAEGVKASRIWLLELDPEAPNTKKHKNLRPQLP